MEIDKLFKKTRRLNAPESLKIKVEKEIADTGTSLEIKVSWVHRLSEFFSIPRGALAATALAVIIIILIRIGQPGKIQHVADDETLAVSKFFNETIEEVYLSTEYTLPQTETGEPEDYIRFFDNQINEIYYLNGGNGNA